MNCKLSGNQLLIRPSKGNGMELHIFASSDVELGFRLALYEVPFIEIQLPFLTVYLGWFNREECDRLDKFFSLPDKEVDNDRPRTGTTRADSQTVV